jgi:Kef-type K+ transport system membrane component KefB
VTSYTGFFSGTATVAGALVGLLFVALSVSPERLRSVAGSVEHQAIAGTAFTALVNALFVSLIGLQPGGGLNYGAVILGALGLTSSCGLAVRLLRSRRTEALSRRWPYLLGFIIVVYAAQVISGFAAKSVSAQEDLSVVFMYTMFATGISRSWELLGLRGGGPLDLLTQRLDAPAPPPPAPAGPESAPRAG